MLKDNDAVCNGIYDDEWCGAVIRRCCSVKSKGTIIMSGGDGLVRQGRSYMRQEQIQKSAIHLSREKAKWRRETLARTPLINRIERDGSAVLKVVDVEPQHQHQQQQARSEVALEESMRSMSLGGASSSSSTPSSPVLKEKEPVGFLKRCKMSCAKSA